jgi:hypothetical protein
LKNYFFWRFVGIFFIYFFIFFKAYFKDIGNRFKSCSRIVVSMNEKGAARAFMRGCYSSPFLCKILLNPRRKEISKFIKKNIPPKKNMEIIEEEDDKKIPDKNMENLDEIPCFFKNLGSSSGSSTPPYYCTRTGFFFGEEMLELSPFHSLLCNPPSFSTPVLVDSHSHVEFSSSFSASPILSVPLPYPKVKSPFLVPSHILISDRLSRIKQICPNLNNFSSSSSDCYSLVNNLASFITIPSIIAPSLKCVTYSLPYNSNSDVLMSSLATAHPTFGSMIDFKNINNLSSHVKFNLGEKVFHKTVGERTGSRIISSEKQSNIDCTIPLYIIRVGQNEELHANYDRNGQYVSFFFFVKCFTF